MGTDAELTARIEQIVNENAEVTNPNVEMLQEWYKDGTDDNKVFANKLIAATLSASKAKASTASTAAPGSTDTMSVSCPVTNYPDFGKLYSHETAGKTWPQINEIDSWVRNKLPAVGAPLSVRKLRDCYRNILSTAEQKHFTDNAV